MLKRFKDLLDVLNSLIKAWPVMFVVIGLIVSAIVRLSRFGSTTVQVGSLNLILIVVVFILAAYPILKLIQWIIQRIFSKNFEYKGLIWKSTIFSLNPYCPHCLREVECIKEAPPQGIITRSPAEIQEYINRAGRYDYLYSCRVHGILPDVPNMNINALADEAKHELKWQKGNAARKTTN